MKIQSQIGLTLFFLLLYLVFREEIAAYQYVICVIAILLFGIPHGAIDHILHRKFSKNKDYPTHRKFITWYVLSMFAYFVVWFLFPFKAFLLFIALALYHFGQEFVEELDIKIDSKAPILLLGSSIMIMPLLLHYQDLAAFLLEVTKVNLPDLNPQTTGNFALLIPAVSIAYFTRSYWKGQLSKSLYFRILAYLVLWVIIYVLTPFLIGFTLYFVLHHSINSMKHQYESLAKLSKQYSLKAYFKDVSVLTLVSYFGIGFLLLISGVQTWEYLTLYALVFISVLTLPHMLVFDDFYNERSAT
ncbi:MAG: Brp/Blh family beta-carotene 15,15'-dioxygenase [Bacteroidota bacterium]